MPAIAEQAGTGGQVLDLHAEAWRDAPRRPGSGQAKACAACDYCCPGCTRLDKWVGSLGGFASARYIALCNEAREATSSAGEQWRYLELAQAADEEHAASPGRWLAGQAIELANARSARRASMRAAEAAAATAVLKRSKALELAVGELRADPRVARVMDAALEDLGLSTAEVAMELRASMGLEARPATSYEAALPPVGDLARMIGVKR
jgi:hypothetical protein